jgi:hypothetical protein
VDDPAGAAGDRERMRTECRHVFVKPHRPVGECRVDLRGYRNYLLGSLVDQAAEKRRGFFGRSLRDLRVNMLRDFFDGTDIQRWTRHTAHLWMAATLDGFVEGVDVVFEAKFMLPWSFSEEAAAEKHMAQLQHNMWVVNAQLAALSIITGGGNWIEMTIRADPLY